MISLPVFSIQQDYDIKYMLVPLRFAQRLLAYENERTGLEIGLDKTANLETVQRSMETLLGDGFVVKNRYQQQEILYKIMKSEKWAIFSFSRSSCSLQHSTLSGRSRC